VVLPGEKWSFFIRNRVLRSGMHSLSYICRAAIGLVPLHRHRHLHLRFPHSESKVLTACEGIIPPYQPTAKNKRKSQLLLDVVRMNASRCHSLGRCVDSN
jgi:hypothetical protein